uniref:Uncharacterized protein n=1 Tax=Callorhinchus milii TaxID=7868 RepID=A0A4W3HC51_CALMI
MRGLLLLLRAGRLLWLSLTLAVLTALTSAQHWSIDNRPGKKRGTEHMIEFLQGVRLRLARIFFPPSCNQKPCSPQVAGEVEELIQSRGRATVELPECSGDNPVSAISAVGERLRRKLHVAANPSGACRD